MVLLLIYLFFKGVKKANLVKLLGKEWAKPI